MKASSTNIQAPEKLQVPNPKKELTNAAFEAWSLKFPWSLELGIWSFAE